MQQAILPSSSFSTPRGRIFLTGFMGSGKSTIGPILANTLGYDFADIDRAVETAAGRTVNEIFLGPGEEHFRTLERAALAELGRRDRIVISLGGGTLADGESCRLVTGSGILVYLRSSPEHLYRRVYRREDRPLLMDREGRRLSDEDLRRRIGELHELRAPLYERADITVDTEGRPVGISVDEIVRLLAPFLRSGRGLLPPA
ncbi:MAG: shikimate kinase [Bacteroidota bacterium]